MTANELRQKYLDFFKQKGHVIIPSASLIPENDPSVLFTTAGMHPLVPFLMGEKHPAGKRLVSCQKCIRTGDIDEVGDNSHLTFFEMLGNWSFGDYWKKEAIEWSWEFLTDKKWLGLDSKKLAVSVFKGDQDCAFDQESYNIWKSLGMPEERIARLSKDDNWWPAGGNSTGPQGPDTEMFYWTGKNEAPEKFDPEEKNWIEIWNDVFMEFNRTADGQYEPLAQRNVDTGMGLERTLTAINGLENVYDTEIFSPLIEMIKTMSGEYEKIAGRIIADHIKAAVLILADPVQIEPSNLGRGYVLRKLLRRAIRYDKKILFSEDKEFLSLLAKEVINLFKDVYPELAQSQDRILKEINNEQALFGKTLERGLKEFNRMSADKVISGVEAFELYSTYGFPLEMTKDLVKEKGIEIKEEDFNQELKKHQKLSRTASAGMFKGGLVDHSEMVTKYHTATHLLHQALQDVLGGHVEQRGSNITNERLRFDFSHGQKMTEQQIRDVEDIVNCKIKEDLPVSFKEMSVAEAKKEGAIGLFAEKYGDKVKVYSIGDYSKEICGGPHVEHTRILGSFKIIKEEASSAGIRRIKAILE